MWILGLMSLTISILIVSILIWFYIRSRNRKKHNTRIQLVSRKEYNKEVELVEMYKDNTDNKMKQLINNFIDEQTKRFNDEKNHEKKRDLLIDIKKDIELLTNSFTWERIETLPNLRKKYKPYIEMLRKQRPSNWEKIK